MMKVLIDILHPAHINFFKNIADTCEKSGHEVVITALNRGKVPAIVQREFPNRPVHIIGRHRGTRYSIIMEANIGRFLRMLWFFLQHRPTVGLSVGSFVSGFCFKLFNRKNYQVDDDPERFMNVLLEKFTATKLFFPPGVLSDHPKVINFNCLKEWAYLSPRYFQPNEDVLTAYGLEKKQYFFIREVSTGTFNYMGQARNPVAGISRDFPEEYRVLLSLEDKSTRDQYPEDWIILQEPVDDIHSLMYYSRAVISSGDSMAREGAMLGVPSIYCGEREMHANQLLIDKGILFHLPIEGTLELIRRLSSDDGLPGKDQAEIRQELLTEWDDINQLLMREIIADLKKK